jgi:hypothetical protein
MKAGGTKYQTCSARYSLGILSLSSHTLHLFVTEHLLVQFFLHFVKEVGAAFVLPAFDISVEAVAVFRINPEYLIEKWGELFERHIAVVDAAHHVYAVDKFHEVDGIARPLKKAGGGFCCVVGGY